jgi:hypothetical protein
MLVSIEMHLWTLEEEYVVLDQTSIKYHLSKNLSMSVYPVHFPMGTFLGIFIAVS